VTEPSRLNEKQDEKMEIEDDKISKPSGSGKGTKGKKVDEITRKIEDASKPVKKKVRRHLGDVIEEAAVKGRFLMGKYVQVKIKNFFLSFLKLNRNYFKKL